MDDPCLRFPTWKMEIMVLNREWRAAEQDSEEHA